MENCKAEELSSGQNSIPPGFQPESHLRFPCPSIETRHAIRKHNGAFCDGGDADWNAYQDCVSERPLWRGSFLDGRGRRKHRQLYGRRMSGIGEWILSFYQGPVWCAHVCQHHGRSDSQKKGTRVPSSASRVLLPEDCCNRSCEE